MSLEDTKPQDASLPNSTGAEKEESAPPAADASLSQSAAEETRKELLYLKAEFENYRKRMVRDQEQAVRFANERFVKELMSVVDQFDRALEHSAPLKTETDGATKTFVDGIELTNRELIHLLQRTGVELVGLKGEKFDPAKHEAISEQGSDDVDPGHILNVLQKGCIFHGRLLQPAKVIVSKVMNIKE